MPMRTLPLTPRPEEIVLEIQTMIHFSDTQALQVMTATTLQPTVGLTPKTFIEQALHLALTDVTSSSNWKRPHGKSVCKLLLEL